jgi:hypothetical protein
MFGKFLFSLAYLNVQCKLDGWVRNSGFGSLSLFLPTLTWTCRVSRNLVQ